MPCSKDFCVQDIIEGKIFNPNEFLKISFDFFFPILGWSDCLSWICQNMPQPHPHPNESVVWPIYLGIAIFLALLIAILILLWKKDCKIFCVEV